MSFSIEGTNIPAKQGRIVKLVSGLPDGLARPQGGFLLYGKFVTMS